MSEIHISEEADAELSDPSGGRAESARNLVMQLIGKASAEADDLAKKAGVILRILKENDSATEEFVAYRITALINNDGAVISAKVG